MLSEFRQLAAQLSPSEWTTNAYAELIERLDHFDAAGDEDALLDYLEAFLNRLKTTAANYKQSPMLPSEVTAETLAGHQLLLEGLESWSSGVDLLVDAVHTGASWDCGLDQAEYGNRLLVAVQRLNQRVTSQTRTPR